MCDTLAVRARTDGERLSIASVPENQMPLPIDTRSDRISLVMSLLLLAQSVLSVCAL